MSDEWVKSTLVSIENKIDKLDTRLDNVDVTLGKQSVILEDHTRRSLANERAVSILEEQLNKEIAPIKEHLIQVHTILKMVGIVSSIVAFILGVLKIASLL